jgi:hypothetical protein
MGELRVISGIITNRDRISSQFGEVKNGQGSWGTNHVTSFRIDGTTQAFFKGAISLADGDRVTVVGEQAGGELWARGIRNRSTNVDYLDPGRKSLGWVLVVVGILTCLLFVGIISLIVGITFLVQDSKKLREIKTLLY